MSPRALLLFAGLIPETREAFLRSIATLADGADRMALERAIAAQDPEAVIRALNLDPRRLRRSQGSVTPRVLRWAGWLRRRRTATQDTRRRPRIRHPLRHRQPARRAHCPGARLDAHPGSDEDAARFRPGTSRYRDFSSARAHAPLPEPLLAPMIRSPPAAPAASWGSRRRSKDGGQRRG